MHDNHTEVRFGNGNNDGCCYGNHNDDNVSGNDDNDLPMQPLDMPIGVAIVKKLLGDTVVIGLKRCAVDENT